MKTVQVLLSSYNGEKYIKEQLESIFNQENVDVHCLVRDDGSKDNTRNILQEYKTKYNKMEIIYGENIGYKKSFLKLVEFSGNYDYYSFADQDDVWKPKKLISAINKIGHAKKDLAVMYCSNCIVVDEQLNEISTLHPKGIDIIPSSKLKAIVEGFAHGCTIVFNKESKEMIMSYMPKYEYAHDFWIPLIHIFMGQIIYDEKGYILYRQHSDNVFGAKRSIFSIIKYRINSFNKGNFYSKLSREIIKGYESELTNKDFIVLSNLIDYKTSLIKKIKLLFNKNLRKKSIRGTVYIKLLILFSKF